MRISLPRNTTGAMSMAIAGAAVMASGIMFIPVSLLEGLIGPTGLSELIPVLGAPLGDGARALIAYWVGAMTLGVLTVLLLRNDGQSARQWIDSNSNRTRHFELSLKNYLPDKMPWAQKAFHIRTLENVSRLRIGNGASDSSVRPPLLASQDLPPLGLVEPIFDGDPIQAAIERYISPSTRLPVAEVEPDLPAKPDLMEAPEECANGVDLTQANVSPIHTSEVRRPVLELVSSIPVKDDNADSALAAALATLHRMTANAL